tara:strand:- start:9064 stop:9891 length:828 start_codon:yes stop_codon:yes gene_type:complete
MSQRDFNRNMNDYLSSRRGTSLKEQFLSAFKKDKTKPAHHTQSHKEEPAIPEEKVFEGGTVEIIEEETLTFLDKVKAFLGFSKSKQDEEVVDLSQHEEVSEQEQEIYQHEEEEFKEDVQKSSFFDTLVRWIFGKKEHQEEEIMEETGSEDDFRRKIEDLEHEEEKIEEQEIILKKRKNEILKDILDRFVGRVEFKESNPDKEELKELAKITVSIIKKLQHKELEEFKNSYEFTRFKEILESQSLLRKKGESQEKPETGSTEEREGEESVQVSKNE